MAAGGTAVVIAVDGPAAAGKGTLARRLAAHFGYAWLDTGILYRATAVAVLAAGGDPTDAAAAVAAARGLDPAFLDDPRRRDEAVADAASRVAAIGAVRAALVDTQRAFARHPPEGSPGAVLDGRDIGTVICPDAAHKIFVTASLEARAGRRLKELQARGVASIHSRVLAEMKERDARDRARDSAPLAASLDALLLDTTDLDADAAFRAALSFIKSRDGSLGP